MSFLEQLPPMVRHILLTPGPGKLEFPGSRKAAVALRSWQQPGIPFSQEDAVYLEKGVLASSNALMVKKARDIIESLGGEIATARDVRAMLSLPM